MILWQVFLHRICSRQSNTPSLLSNPALSHFSISFEPWINFPFFFFFWCGLCYIYCCSSLSACCCLWTTVSSIFVLLRERWMAFCIKPFLKSITAWLYSHRNYSSLDTCIQAYSLFFFVGVPEGFLRLSQLSRDWVWEEHVLYLLQPFAEHAYKIRFDFIHKGIGEVKVI